MFIAIALIREIVAILSLIWLKVGIGAKNFFRYDPVEFDSDPAGEFAHHLSTGLPQA